MSTRCGIHHPDVVDLITRGDDAFRLIVVEEQKLLDSDAPALQEKLNNYLGFALDGPLVEHYPDSRGMPVCIRVDLYASPSQLIVDFLRHYAPAVAQYGVSLELSINGEVFACTA